MKKFLTLALALAMVLGSFSFCFANLDNPIVTLDGMATTLSLDEPYVSPEATKAAEELYKLGLFSGTGTNDDGTPIFSLDRVPTRNEAITMLVALLGQSKEAKFTPITMPFTDVADWAAPFVNYAYQQGLTAGTSKDRFSGESPVTATQFLSYALAALKYQAGKDFQWNEAWKLSDKLGIAKGKYNANTTEFTRGDMAIIARDALKATAKGSSQIFVYDLMKDYVVTCKDVEEFLGLKEENPQPEQITRPKVSKTPVIVLDWALISDDHADYTLTILYAGEKLEVKSKIKDFTETTFANPKMYKLTLDVNHVVKSLAVFPFERTKTFTDFSSKTKISGDIVTMANGQKIALDDDAVIYTLESGSDDWKIGSKASLSIAANGAEKAVFYDIDDDDLYDYVLVFEK